MKVWLEPSAMTWAYYDNYPEVTFRLEGSELDWAADKTRKTKGYAPLFDWDDKRIQTKGWYDFYVIINAETEEVSELWAEIHGDVDEELCPDYMENTYLEFDSDDIVRQIKEQLKKDYDMELKDLKEAS